MYKRHSFYPHSGGRFLLLLTLILCSQTTYAQDAERSSPLHHQWMNLEAGGTQIGPAAGLVFSDYNTANNNLISVRGMITTSGIGGYKYAYEAIAPHNNYLWDVGLMFGKGLQGRYYFLSLSAGIGIVGGVKYSSGVQPLSSDFNSIDKNFTTICIPIQAQAHFIPLRFIGVGLEGIANVNPKYSTWGVMVSLQLGGLLF